MMHACCLLHSHLQRIDTVCGKIRYVISILARSFSMETVEAEIKLCEEQLKTMQRQHNVDQLRR